MKSRWFEYKDKAIQLRKSGLSIKDIEKKLFIPRSTLSGWFKDVKLSKKQKKSIDIKWKKSLAISRQKAVIWHNKQKEERLKTAEQEALTTLNKVNLRDKNVLELALSMLYLGEGAKTQRTSIGNSNLTLLKFIIRSMEKVYGFSRNNIKCDLHLRADQNPILMKKYWSANLKIPILNFKTISVDYRTVGRATYSDYKGVCVLNFGTVAIQRKLVYLSSQFCKKIIKGD